MKQIKFYFESLGCAKNLVDSELIISKLLSNGFTQALSPGKADFLFVNTCCFIENARKESFERIKELYKIKKDNSSKIIILGCMASRYGEKLKEELPFIDTCVKISQYKEFENIFPYKSFFSINPKRKITASLTPRYSSYLRISDGCIHNCSFCAIPGIRGRLKSEPAEELVKKAEFKAASGVKELNIIAQDSLSYGIDIYGKRDIVTLLKRLVKINDLKWIRILYMYPSHINDELLNFMKNKEKLCNYFDIPLQHTEKRILQLMGRPFDAHYYEKLIDKIRSKVPGSFIRSTFIAGFPTETKKEFIALLKFIKNIKFDHLGAFAYSNEEGTKSYGLSKQIAETEKQKRVEEIMFAQQEVLEEKNKREAGKIYDVIIDAKESVQRSAFSVHNTKKYTYTGRTKLDAPEIDRLFHLKSEKKLKIGDIIKAKVTKADFYDLYGKAMY